MVRNIWVGMPTTNIHLLQLKIQNHLQKRRLPNGSTSELIPKSSFCIFFASKCVNQIATLSTLKSSLLDKIIKYASRWFILAIITLNLELASLKRITCLCPLKYVVVIVSYLKVHLEVILHRNLPRTSCVQLALRGYNAAGLFSTTFTDIFECDNPEEIAPATVIDVNRKIKFSTIHCLLSRAEVTKSCYVNYRYSCMKVVK